MLKKIILIPLVATPVVAVGVITPAVIFASKNQANNSSSNIENDGNNVNAVKYYETKETIMHDSLTASLLGLPQSKEELKKFINDSTLSKYWVIDKKDILFIGTTSLLTSSSQIANIITVDNNPSSDLVTLIISLKEGSYVDSSQQVAQGNKSFMFIIDVSK